MNGHNEECECVDCVAARQCGMTDAVDLIRLMRSALSDVASESERQEAKRAADIFLFTNS